MPEVLCRPVLQPGTGLGNRLFPWARCLLFARRHGARMIDPIWERPAIGQLFRGGIDYRSYMRQLVMFRLMQRDPANLGPVAGLLRSRGARVVTEPADWRSPAGGAGRLLVCFKDIGAVFAPLVGQHEFLLRELRAITRERYRRLADAAGEVPIAICVRCGNDYREPTGAPYAPLGPADKTPLGWYVDTLRLVRREVGRPVRAVVVSDGTRAALRPLLEMDNVSFARPGTAISDLLILSRAKVLLAPGASSFAAWASFFGQMPTATHPGQPLQAWHLDGGPGRFVGELNPSAPDQTFLRDAAAAL